MTMTHTVQADKMLTNERLAFEKRVVVGPCEALEGVEHEVGKQKHCVRGSHDECDAHRALLHCVLS